MLDLFYICKLFFTNFSYFIHLFIEQTFVDVCVLEDVLGTGNLYLKGALSGRKERYPQTIEMC